MFKGKTAEERRSRHFSGAMKEEREVTG